MENTKITAATILKLCLDKFNSLPKTGKPTKSEWTVLAGVVMQKTGGNSEVVSLGCGTRCIGKSKLCPNGFILNDSHGEVLARRGLLRYFYQQIKLALSGDASIFKWLPERKKLRLMQGLTFHFLSTQTPCGDACIIDSDAKLKDTEIDNIGVCVEPLVKKRKFYVSEENLSSNTVYTGAKLLDSSHSDVMNQVIGEVRTKPGRGERTLSMSCSDKLAKWQVMGVQGALLASLLDEPIYFETLNFCGNDYAAIERAIWRRFERTNYCNENFKLSVPKIQLCQFADFKYFQDEQKLPSPNGLVWCNIPSDLKPYEVSVNGKRQGITHKKSFTPLASLAVSKYNLFKEFSNIVRNQDELLTEFKDCELKTYFEVKQMSIEYQRAWSEANEKYFKKWTEKPCDLLKFVITNANLAENHKKDELQ